MAIAPPLVLQTTANKISISGGVNIADIRKIFAAIHNTVNNLGYRDIELDFSDCKAAFLGSMVAIAAVAEKYLVQGVDVDLILPTDDSLKRLFLNTNWAHLIDPRRYEPSNFRGAAQLPATKYKTGADQFAAVQNVIQMMLSSASKFDRSHLKAFEWSLNEITDNVINHAESPIGGLLQVSFFRNKKTVEFAVCDAGMGIPHSLKTGHKELRTDHEALDRAIREGVTRDPNAGQGNGLYGSWRIAQLSGGRFQIHSGYASLIASPDRMHIRPEPVPFMGTLVIISINYDEPLSLEEALRFKGRPHDPVDLVQIQYEEVEDGKVLFRLANEAVGFGSRAAGQPLRQKLRNLMHVCDGKKVIIDLAGIPIISSSFADEVFGKLFVELGPVGFIDRSN